MKKIKVFVTAQGVMRDVEGNFNTWGELRTKLNQMGISTDGVKATVREGQISFEADEAVLPSGVGRDLNNNPNGYDFTLFLNPVQTKSGLVK